MLEEGRSNYLCSVFLDYTSGAVAFCDISTGEFCLTSFKKDVPTHIINELARFSPREAVLSPGASKNREICEFLTRRLGCLIEMGEDRFDFMQSAARICEQFSVSSLDEVGLGDSPAGVCAAGGLLSYIKETQKCELAHIRTLDSYSGSRYMELDYTTRRNLELTENLRTGEKRGSLLWVLDKTKTPMGGRLLRSWVERPLLSPVAIKRRLAAVQELVAGNVTRSEIMQHRKDIGDIQRLTGRGVYGTANGRDRLALGNYCAKPGLPGGRPEGAKSAMLRGSRMDVLEDVSA